jgi:hypothetical protein
MPKPPRDYIVTIPASDAVAEVLIRHYRATAADIAGNVCISSAMLDYLLAGALLPDVPRQVSDPWVGA